MMAAECRTEAPEKLVRIAAADVVAVPGNAPAPDSAGRADEAAVEAAEEAAEEAEA